MSPSQVVPDILLYLALSALALVLLVGWLVWAARGGRAVDINFKGLGMSVNIASKPTNKSETDALTPK